MTTGIEQPNLDEMTVSDLHRFCKDNAISGHWSNNLRGREKLISYIKKFLEVSQTEQAIEVSPDPAPGAEAVEEDTAEQPVSYFRADEPQVANDDENEEHCPLCDKPLYNGRCQNLKCANCLRWPGHDTGKRPPTPEAWLDDHGFRSYFSDNLSQPAARWGRWAMWEAFTTHAKVRYLQVVHLSSNKCWHIFWQNHWHSFKDAARSMTNVIAALEPVVVADASYCEVAMPVQVFKPTRTPKLMLCLLGLLLVGQAAADCDRPGGECRRWVEVLV